MQLAVRTRSGRVGDLAAPRAAGEGKCRAGRLGADGLSAKAADAGTVSRRAILLRRPNPLLRPRPQREGGAAGLDWADV